MELNNTAIAAIFEALMNVNHYQHQEARRMAEQFINEQRDALQERLRRDVMEHGPYDD
jgi:hypothetical protein